MRVDTDDFARPRGCGKNHLVEVEEILIEPGAVNALGGSYVRWIPEGIHISASDL